MSIAGGLHMALERASALGCTCMQIFSHNPRGWRTSPVTEEGAELFRRRRAELGIGPVFIHTSYLINIASPKDELRQKSLLMLRDELLRASVIGAEYVVTHTGTAHDEEGRDRAISSIREALDGVKATAGLLIENTSGKRGDIASRMADLAEIRDGSGGFVAGVCIDSCHAYAAGYDLSTQKGAQTLAREVGESLGEDAVRLIHLNDSKGELGSGTDRHEHLGKGRLGMEGLGFFISQPVFSQCPIVIETPKDKDEDDVANLDTLRKMLS